MAHATPPLTFHQTHDSISAGNGGSIYVLPLTSVQWLVVNNVIRIALPAPINKPTSDARTTPGTIFTQKKR